MEIINIFIYSFLSACLSLFINKCFQKDMIFRRYFLLLTYYWIKWHKRKDRWKRKVLKPIGLCIYCYSTWVSIFVFFTISTNPILLFLFIGLNYIWVEILLKMIKLI